MKSKKFVHAVFFKHIHFIESYSLDNHRVYKRETNKTNFNMI